jgi:hypothetical protein
MSRPSVWRLALPLLNNGSRVESLAPSLLSLSAQYAVDTKLDELLSTAWQVGPSRAAAACIPPRFISFSPALLRGRLRLGTCQSARALPERAGGLRAAYAAQPLSSPAAAHPVGGPPSAPALAAPAWLSRQAGSPSTAMRRCRRASPTCTPLACQPRAALAARSSRAAQMELWRDDPDTALSSYLVNELALLRPPRCARAGRGQLGPSWVTRQPRQAKRGGRFT